MRKLITTLILLCSPVLLLATPNAPSDLVLTPTSSSVTLSWSDNSSDESGFKIFRDGVIVGYTDAGIATYTDSGLSPHTSYTYTVKATTDTIPSVLQSTEKYDILQQSYPIESTATPFDNAVDFQVSPFSWSNRYSRKREYFPTLHDGNLAVVWQDQVTDSSKVYYSKFDGAVQQYEEIELHSDFTDDALAAATTDDDGNIYYLMLQHGDGSADESSRRATLYKANSNGSLLLKRSIDTSTNGLNMVEFDRWGADMRYSAGTLGLMVGRIMHASNDGLHHQGGIAVVFDASNLEVLRNLGQTSGHSFENYLITNSAGEFVGIDLGDNYPRGINLTKFTQDGKHNKVVYSFKTKHGTTATSPSGQEYDLYEEISDANHQYYKWSNDNNTYTELGAVIELDDGNYLVTFIGEPNAQGKAIDNSRVGEYVNDARNVGFVKVSSDLSTILSDGISETGGFYTFGGWWSNLSNEGINWLTNYTDMNTENAARLKSAKLPNGDIVILWESWKNYDYLSTSMMVIDANGNVKLGAQTLPTQVRLSRRDNLIVKNNSVIIFSGDKTDKKLEIIEVKFKGL